MRIAVIRDGVIESIEERTDGTAILYADDPRPFTVPPGSFALDVTGNDTAAVGGTYDGKQFSPPPPAQDDINAAVLADLARLVPDGNAAQLTAQQALARPAQAVQANAIANP